MEIRKELDPIPFVLSHTDAKVVVESLDGKGDMILYGSDQDAFRFRQLLLGLNINMLCCVQKTEIASSRMLYGYELLDIISEPGKGTCMRQMSIEATGRDLLHIARLADAVVIGAGFGDVIEPVKCGNDGKSKVCDRVPLGFDYLTAPISCLDKLISRHGTTIDAFNNCYIEISAGTYWVVSESSFQVCGHEIGSEDNCWRIKETFQHLETRKLQKIRTNGSIYPPSEMPLEGAVVFGKPRK